MQERLYYLGFSNFAGIGPMKFKLLLNTFGTAKDAWEASSADLKKQLGEVLSVKFEKFRREFSIKNYTEELIRKNVQFLIFTENEYPALLKQIKNPPFMLYVRGSQEILSQGSCDKIGVGYDRFIGVVGTRKITNYGREVTKIITADLVAAGFTIISGLALGVDAAAHKTTLENNGNTIAVLGCGVDCCNPRENQNLYTSIIEKGGAIISELPLGRAPTIGSFPSRNRIIAGLSLGVVITEGAIDSGSLITADYAFKNNRKVFAVPGPITSDLSKGPYKLISKGAKLITSASDIVNELKLQIPNYKSQINSKIQSSKGDNSAENKILKLLQSEALHFDELVGKSNIPSSKLGSLLSIMEIKGMIKGLGNGMFGLVS